MYLYTVKAVTRGNCIVLERYVNKSEQGKHELNMSLQYLKNRIIQLLKEHERRNKNKNRT